MTMLLNSKGEKVSSNEVFSARDLENHAVLKNSITRQTGLEIDITNLTFVIQQVSQQKFYELPLADYMPIAVGKGAWSPTITKYREFVNGSDFEDGFVGVAREARLEETSAYIDALSIKTHNWAKTNVWNLFDIEYASRSGVWDIVEAKERSRKKNWDLGIQKMLFLGMRGGTGLLNDGSTTVNQSLMGASLKDMTDAQFNTFVAGVIGAFRSNCQYTAMPNRLVIPESDFTGLSTYVSTLNPNLTRLQYLENALKATTMRNDFKILPSVYAQASYGALSADRYALYNCDADTLELNIPVQYTATQMQSIEGFNFQNVAYGQIADMLIVRPRELMYFEVNAG